MVVQHGTSRSFLSFDGRFIAERNSVEIWLKVVISPGSFERLRSLVVKESTYLLLDIFERHNRRKRTVTPRTTSHRLRTRLEQRESNLYSPMAAEVRHKKNPKSVVFKSPSNNKDNQKTVVIEARDVSSLLEKFLEYEESQTHTKVEDSSIALTPVSSPGNKNLSPLGFPVKDPVTNKMQSSTNHAFGLTPPVSPPSSNTSSPNLLPEFIPLSSEKSQENKPSGEFKSVGNNNEKENACNNKIEREDMELSPSDSNSGESCIIEKADSSACRCPTTTDQQTQRSDRSDYFPETHNKTIENVAINKLTGMIPFFPLNVNSSQSGLSKDAADRFGNESGEDEPRFNPRNAEKEGSRSSRRSPDPYASSDSEDERDRIRWRQLEKERRWRHEQRSRRDESHSRSRSRSRGRSWSRQRSPSQERRRIHSRRHNDRRGREQSVEVKERTDEDRLYDIEHERKKTFRIDRSFREASREERRIVYVGKISDDTHKDDVWRRFRKYGPIEKVTVHFRDNGDNYAFVTFVESASALDAVNDANSNPKEPALDICFGGRRKFCGGSYVDFDSNTSYIEEKLMNGAGPKDEDGSGDELDFDALLRMAMKRK
ncbi:peroxisome proliferator-activated receptor gamma coactivator 1-alpha isoform X2 [Nematostella vectensis]|uniref:peroxisome proliferator-activated receptor gamma coactivator 1-alpha isoform X2 n=1 Tax=Nematostella vectensis TaxID=45351 RepID=UPI0020777B7B|nr:peroxisome proliferator-activated receptor gamma coactivator 1-alpha isoform X2 [Nematostella vectensis]